MLPLVRKIGWGAGRSVGLLFLPAWRPTLAVLVPFGHHIDCSYNRRDDFAWGFETGFVVHGLSIGQYCQSFGRLGLPLQHVASNLGTWGVLLLSLLLLRHFEVSHEGRVGGFLGFLPDILPVVLVP